MMQWLRIWCIILLICIGEVYSSEAVVRVVGATADNAPPPVLTGLCTGTFTMSQVGVLSFTETSSLLVHDVAPSQQNYDGFGYIVINNGAGTETAYVYSLDTFAVTTSAPLNVANVPDSANTFGGSHYNSFTDLWTVLGNKPTGGGCLLTNGCVHIRGYASGSVTALSDIITGTNITGSTFAKAQVDTIFTYVAVENLAVRRLHQLTTATGASVQDVSQNSSYELRTQDATYLYAGEGTVVRYTEKTNFINSATFTFVSAGGGVGGLAVNDGFIYVGVSSDSIQANRLHKINLTGFGTTATLLFGATEFIQNVLLDSVNQKLYVILNVAGTTRIKRVDIATFTVEQTYNGIVGSNGPRGIYVSIDVPHQKIFAPSSGGGGFVTKIEKINLCS